MTGARQRLIVRGIHIVCGIPIIGYIYSPFDAVPNYAPATRLVFLPLMLFSGVWMWKGQGLRELFSKGSGRGHKRDASCAPKKDGEFSFGNREPRS